MAKFNQGNALLRICIDAVQDDRLAGLVYSQMLTQPMPFSDAAQLVLQIEALLDAQNFPQAFQRARVFYPEKREFALAADGPEGGLAAQAVAAATGALATADVRVVSRRSSTWQGTIAWADGAPPLPFSSALEFMRLMDMKRPAK